MPSNEFARANIAAVQLMSCQLQHQSFILPYGDLQVVVDLIQMVLLMRLPI